MYGLIKVLLVSLLTVSLNEQEIREHTTIEVDGSSFNFVVKKYEPYTCVLTIKRGQKTILTDSLKEFYDYGEFKDFNKDGHVDFMTIQLSNLTWRNLYLYNPLEKNYHLVKGFTKFFDPLPVPGHKGYYYSYRKNGCADDNWISDLFVIRNFTPIRIARINALYCTREGEKKRIEIRVYSGDDTFEVVRELPYNIIDSYESYKWGFIKAYWTDNLESFK